jgi:hypothetical protein
MQDWDMDWKVPLDEQEMETYNIDIEEVQHLGNGASKKRKDTETKKGKSVWHYKRRKTDKDTIAVTLMEEEFERFGEKVKDIIDDMFQHTV